MRRFGVALLAAGVAALTSADAQAAGENAKKPPYFASIGAGRARMRSGPARSYPATWLYVRADLPVKVVSVFKEWRKVEDPDGTQGWMLGNLLSGTRTGVVTGAVAELRETPTAGAKVTWRAQPGVIGRLSQCVGGWCRFDVKGQAGFVEVGKLWGVTLAETLP